MASVYAQRVDWLICGDDSEESFHERLAEDLAKITEEQIEKDIQEQINYLTNDEDWANAWLQLRGLVSN